MIQKKENNRAVTPATTLKSEAKRLFQNRQWHPLPFLVITILLITTIGVIFQLLDPTVFLALRRDPVALSRGEWWRVITPLLVNDGDPFWHFVFDTFGLILVGTVTERLLGQVRWLILFLVGAAAGTIAGYLWNPYGAGLSISLCGLISGLVIWQIRRNDFHLLPSIYSLGLAFTLTCEVVVEAFVSNKLIGMLIVVIICCALINLLLLLHKRKPATQLSTYFVGGGVLLCALVLISMRDIHGIALLTGLVMATLILWRTPKSPETSF
jgi:rhomboid protease GluP